MRRNRVVRGIGVALLATAVFAVCGEVVAQLWNVLTPGIFGWHTIGFWQAIGLILLSRILFGGFRGRGGYGMPWRRRMRDRWSKMSPEEREKFREGMRGRCGGFGFPEEAPRT